jgi:hypothetical protein
VSARHSSLLLVLRCFCGGLAGARRRCGVEVFCVLLLFSGNGRDSVDISVAGFLNFSVVEDVSFFSLLVFARGRISGTSSVFRVAGEIGNRGLFLFLLRGVVSRWSFNVYVSSCRVWKATALAAPPMFGAALRDGRWSWLEAGSRRWRAGAPELICALEDWQYLDVICFSFRVLFEKSRGCVCNSSVPSF